VHAAAEIHQPLRAINEGGEQVRGNNIDRQNLRAAVDAGVVDHRVETAQPVDLLGHTSRLVQFGQVPDDG
jgi:hypothetical protein